MQPYKSAMLMVIVLTPAAFHPGAARADRVAPRIEHPDAIDRDNNAVADTLDATIAAMTAAGRSGESVRVTVGLYQPPTADDAAAFRNAGGVLEHQFRYATYGLAGPVPAGAIGTLAATLGDKVCIIEHEGVARAALDDSARQSRVRPGVWDAGYSGDPNIVIGIIDTGVDGTHTDLSGRLLFSVDFTGQGTDDENGHGTHVAGIAAGSGAALGGSGNTTITTTMSGHFPTSTGFGFVDMIKVPVGSGDVTSELRWNHIAGENAYIDLADSGGNWIYYFYGENPPLTWTWDQSSLNGIDVYKAFVGWWSGSTLGGEPYSMQTTYPYADVGDGYNLFRGIAPECKLVALKVLRADGTGQGSWITAAFDWLVAPSADNNDVNNNQYYNIKVANASLSLDPTQAGGGINTTMRTAANSVVDAGTVLVIAAGNYFADGYTVVDPGLAEDAITVGAINDFGAMTDYSSNGIPALPPKPEIVAPGGSHSWNSNVGSEITAPDSNVGDADNDLPDQNPDDYANLNGTSMAAPHVAGVAALIIDALQQDGHTWAWGIVDPYYVKMLIELTGTETNRPGEENSGNDPPLWRVSPDAVEGFGKINADAAIAAATRQWDLTNVQAFLGAAVNQKKCWAREADFCGSPYTHRVKLHVPPGADFDLIAYYRTFASGLPWEVAWSVNAGLGVDENILFGYTGSFNYPAYIVVKWIEGSGTFELEYIHAGCAGSTGIIIGGDTVEDWDVATTSEPGHPEPQVTVEEVAGRQNALHIYRPADTTASSAVASQTLDLGLTEGAEVTLRFDVRIESHNFADFDVEAVYPATVKVTYEDASGSQNVLARSFYTHVDSGTPDSPPLAEQIEEAVWTSRLYRLSDLSPAVTRIVGLSVESEGWSYDVAFDAITLDAGVPLCTDYRDDDGTGESEATIDYWDDQMEKTVQVTDDPSAAALARLWIYGQPYNYPGHDFENRVDYFIRVNGDANQEIWFDVGQAFDYDTTAFQWVAFDVPLEWLTAGDNTFFITEADAPNELMHWETNNLRVGVDTDSDFDRSWWYGNGAFCGSGPLCDGELMIYLEMCSNTMIFGDGDGDGDVDLSDFADFRGCLSGPGGVAPPGCEVFDSEPDGDVDWNDFAAFQLAFTGTP